MTRHTDPLPISILTDARSRGAALAVALTALALLGAVAAAGTATAQSDDPTVRVVGNEVTPDGTATVGVVLTTAPDGLSGYYLDVSIADPGVARIESASYPDRFGLTTTPAVSDGGATVTLEAADMEGAIEPGATDVTLATIRIAGVETGETALSVDPRQFDADDGSAFEPATGAGTVTVGDGDGDASTDDTAANDADGTADGTDAGDADEAAETAGSGPFPAALAVLALFAAGLLLARRT
jgi:hypothetical protein